MSEMREILRHYFNIGTPEAPEYVLLGDGITSLTEEFNPEAGSKHFINNSSGTNTVKSYTPSISIEKEYIKDDELQKWINTKIVTLPTGAQAISDYVRVNIAVEPTKEGAYTAVKRRSTFQFNSIGGDAGSELMNSMTLGGAGDGIVGTFNVTTKIFTPNE